MENTANKINSDTDPLRRGVFQRSPYGPSEGRPSKYIPAWLRNKYFLCSAGFIVWMIFFDPRDIYSQLDHTRQLNELQASKQHYQKEIAKEEGELEQLKTNPATLEKYAREKYLMKKENEDLFIIPEKPDAVNK